MARRQMMRPGPPMVDKLGARFGAGNCDLSQAASVGDAAKVKLEFDQAGGDGLRDSLGARGYAKLGAGVVQMEIDGAAGQAEDLGDLGRGLATSRPDQGLYLALAESDAPPVNFASGTA